MCKHDYGKDDLMPTHFETVLVQAWNVVFLNIIWDGN